MRTSHLTTSIPNPRSRRACSGRSLRIACGRRCSDVPPLSGMCLRASEARSNRLAALNSLGRYEEAAAPGERAMAQDARHPHVLIEMGTAYWRLRRFAKARSCAKRALEIDPQFEPAQRLLNLIRQGRGEGGGQ